MALGGILADSIVVADAGELAGLTVPGFDCFGGRRYAFLGGVAPASEALSKIQKIPLLTSSIARCSLEPMLGADTIPLPVLVDANGRVLEKIRAAYDWDSPKAIEALGKTFHIKM